MASMSGDTSDTGGDTGDDTGDDTGGDTGSDEACLSGPAAPKYPGLRKGEDATQ